MLNLNITLSHYKRRDIQEEMIEAAKNKEVAVRYEDKFGNRPDVLTNPGDILELAKQRATSFHCSEEIWNNPLQLGPNLKKHDLDSLRMGWDLVLDVDCPVWELSKIITWLMVKSLKKHDIDALSVKFSGNKGFHIGVPFEAFPTTIGKIQTKNLFPDTPRRVAIYLLDYISNNHIEVEDEKIIFGKKFRIPLSIISEVTKKNREELTKRYCKKCGVQIKNEERKKTEFICKRCNSRVLGNNGFMECQKCRILMEKFESSICDCGSNEYDQKFNALSIIEVDTILISSRHLYRMPYSLHEKSGLVSVPIDPEKVLDFDKKDADPKGLQMHKLMFLDRRNVKDGEAKKLVTQALDFSLSREDEIKIGNKKIYETPLAIREENFPPCIKLIANGLSDGRKRALFILINFLTSVGWDYGNIETFLREWNKKNTEPLRENYIVGQLRYHKTQKKKILPPNCNNMMYYVNIGVCRPDNLCSKIKNPVSYAKRKGFFSNKLPNDIKASSKEEPKVQ